MGVSTDAIVFYGYCWEDEATLLEELDSASEWEDVIARRRGAVNPWDTFVEPTGGTYEQRRAESDAWVANHRAEIDAWYAAKRQVKEESGVDIGRHGSGEWQVPYIYAAESRQRAYRGDAHIIDPGGMEHAATDLWDESIAAFVAELGIDTSEAKGPAWFLVSWWG